MIKKKSLCKIIFTSSIVAASLFGANPLVYAAAKSDTNNAPAQVSAADLQRLSTVINEIKKYYVKKVDDKTLFDNAISGMLSGLDPHSEYLKKDDLEALSTATIGKFDGIGVEVVPYQGLVKIISPLDDSPAYKAGIKAGDVIVEINNKLVKDITLDEAVSLMRGPKGSKLKLLILRKNATKPLTFNIVRNTIKVQTVKARLLENGYAYVRVGFFQEPTESDMVKAIKKLKRDSGGNLKGIILDLRNDPGGLLDVSVAIADDFLDAKKLKGDKVIVYTKGYDNGTQITAKATPGELLPDVPMVVLINEGSASASEIVAGALQDYKRALIVGNKSFGKGSVQTLLPVDKDSAIKLTTALYYTPLGRSIQAKGIEPDVTVDEIHLPKNVENYSDYDTLTENSLDGHLQNGNSNPEGKPTPKENTSAKPDSSATDSSLDDSNDNSSNDTSNNLKLAKEDYQLYEALNILKGLSKFNCLKE